MKSLIIGDIHVKVSNLDVNAKLFDIIEELIKDKPKEIWNIILLGDVYDTKAIIRSEAQNFLINRLERLSKYNKYILTGNHDYENLNCINSAIEPLDLINRVCVVSHGEYDEHLNAIFMPYRHTNDEFIKELSNAINSSGGKCNNKTVVFCHQGFLGFDMGTGILDKTSVDPAILPKLKYIVGHYHAAQEKDNINYLGTPFSHSFGEANQNKQIAILDHDTGILEYIPMNDKLPQHYKLIYNKDGVYPYKIKDGDFVEILVDCGENDVTILTKDVVAESLGKVNCNVRVKYNILNSEKNIRLNENLAHEQMLKQYLDLKGRPDLFNKGLEVLKNAIL